MPATLIHGQDGMPATLAAEYGTVSAVCMVGDAECGRFTWGALLAAAETGTARAWLLTGSVTAPAIAAPPDLAAATAAAIGAGRIKILRHRLGRPAPAQIRTMLAEFDYFAPAANSLLLIDCGEHWFDQPIRRGRAPLIESLRQWAQRRQLAVVLLFYAPAARAVDRAAELLVFSRQLSGIARIARESRRADAPPPAPDAAASAPLRCRLLFWFGPGAMQSDATLTLNIGTDGALRSVAAAGRRPERHTPLDADRVVVQRSALAGSGGAPVHWVVCDTLSDVLTACTDAVAATVILAFERTTPNDALMQLVFRLRQTAGGRLKIIVRELQVRMRYNEDALIARLGANLIVPMEVGYARFLSMMEMVQSQVFSAALPATFEAALEDGLPDQALGYLPPLAFARAVADTLARSRALAIDNVLVRLTLVNGLTPLDAMRHCSLKRAGDLFTADRKSVLVFLFACRELDATQTLSRIFALPIGELFGSEHRYLANPAARSAIEDFSQRAANGRLPDLSAELLRIAALRTPMPSTAPISPAGAVGATSAARLPLHTPLRLRSAGDILLAQPAAMLPTLT